MKVAKISELRDQLSRYLDHVRAGGRVLVLDRDRPVAEIVPVGRSRSGKGESDETLLAALEREGLLVRGTGSIPPELLRGDAPGEGAGVLAALLEERDSGR
jgi:antitoxin (DNA-binding transcriptional repressor) of toxin-antitoxin stability system